MMVWFNNTRKKLHEIMKHIANMTLTEWLDTIGIMLSWMICVSLTVIAISDVMFLMGNHASIALTVFQYATITLLILLVLLIIIAFIRMNHE